MSNLDLSKLITAEEKLQQRIESKRRAIQRDYTDAMDQIAGQYPDRERETWHKQLAEAQALDADPDAPTPYIDSCVAESGEDRSALAANILSKDAAYAQHAGQAAGVMRRRLRELDGVDTESEDALQQIDVI